jgi:hypothetical protein
VNIGSSVVKQLSERFYFSNRVVTADNFFSSVLLAMELLRKGMFFVATIRKNKPQVPECFLPKRNRAILSCLFAFTYWLTLVSYVPKLNKSVVLISTLHHDNSRELSAGLKPKIITFYNQEKVGCDTFDQLCSNYTCRRRTNRFFFFLFCSIYAKFNSNKFSLKVAYECFFFHTRRSNAELLHFVFVE